MSVYESLVGRMAYFWANPAEIEKVTLPLYCAVGTGNSDRDLDRSLSALEHESYRKSIDSAIVEPISRLCRLSTVFDGKEAGGVWREFALFDSLDKSQYVDICESISSGTTQLWGTDSNGNYLLSTEVNNAVQGTACLRAEGNGTGNVFLTYLLGAGAGIMLIGFTSSKARLQYHLYVDKPANAGEISTGIGNDSGNLWYWVIDATAFSAGWNFLDLSMSSSTIVGAPSWSTPMKHFYVRARTQSASVVWMLDYIRMYEDSGTMFDRALIWPYRVKTYGESVTVTFLLDLAARVV